MSFELDDLWLEKMSGLKSLSLAQKRRLYRIIMVMVAGISYSLDTLLLGLFYVAGTIPDQIPLFYGLAGLGHVLIFSAIHWSGLSDSLSNPHMTLWQMVYSISVQVTGIILCPQLTQFFLGIMLVIFSFGALRISLRQTLIIWSLATLALIVTLMSNSNSTMGIVEPNRTEVILVGITFATILLRTISLGYYATALRMRLYQKTHSFELAAMHDALTGALNRNAIIPILEEHIALHRRKAIPGCIALIDIDHFKDVNDNFGHLVGDEVLKQISRHIIQDTRDVDKLSRYGGEEFLLLMPATHEEEGLIIVERMRETIHQMTFSDSMENHKITVSCGITSIAVNDTIDSLIQRADLALYQAKHLGRNQVCLKN